MLSAYGLSLTKVKVSRWRAVLVGSIFLIIVSWGPSLWFLFSFDDGGRDRPSNVAFFSIWFDLFIALFVMQSWFQKYFKKNIFFLFKLFFYVLNVLILKIIFKYLKNINLIKFQTKNILNNCYKIFKYQHQESATVRRISSGPLLLFHYLK